MKFLLKTSILLLIPMECNSNEFIVNENILNKLNLSNFIINNVSDSYGNGMKNVLVVINNDNVGVFNLNFIKGEDFLVNDELLKKLGINKKNKIKNTFKENFPNSSIYLNQGKLEIALPNEFMNKKKVDRHLNYFTNYSIGSNNEKLSGSISQTLRYNDIALKNRMLITNKKINYDLYMEKITNNLIYSLGKMVIRNSISSGGVFYGVNIRRNIEYINSYTTTIEDILYQPSLVQLLYNGEVIYENNSSSGFFRIDNIRLPFGWNYITLKKIGINGDVSEKEIFPNKEYLYLNGSKNFEIDFGYSSLEKTPLLSLEYDIYSSKNILLSSAFYADKNKQLVSMSLSDAIYNSNHSLIIGYNDKFTYDFLSGVNIPINKKTNVGFYFRYFEGKKRTLILSSSVRFYLANNFSSLLNMKYIKSNKDYFSTSLSFSGELVSNNLFYDINTFVDDRDKGVSLNINYLMRNKMRNIIGYSFVKYNDLYTNQLRVRGIIDGLNYNLSALNKSNNKNIYTFNLNKEIKDVNVSMGCISYNKNNCYGRAYGGIAINEYGFFMTSKRIYDTHGVVNTDIENLKIKTPLGTVFTGKNGKAFVAKFKPYVNNEIIVNTSTLPELIDIDNAYQAVKPQKGGFQVINITSKKLISPLKTIMFNGNKIKEGSIVQDINGGFIALVNQNSEIAQLSLFKNNKYIVKTISGNYICQFIYQQNDVIKCSEMLKQ